MKKCDKCGSKNIFPYKDLQNIPSNIIGYISFKCEDCGNIKTKYFPKYSKNKGMG
jgi:RNase P subunit RPR2